MALATAKMVSSFGETLGALGGFDGFGAGMGAGDLRNGFKAWWGWG